MSAKHRRIERDVTSREWTRACCSIIERTLGEWDPPLEVYLPVLELIAAFSEPSTWFS